MRRPRRARFGAVRLFAAGSLASALFAAGSASATCMRVAPELEMWIEVVDCNENLQAELADRLFLQSIEFPEFLPASRVVPHSLSLERQTGGLLLRARILARAETAKPYYASEGGKSEKKNPTKVGVWEAVEPPEVADYLFVTRTWHCDELESASPLVVRQVFSCCDVQPPADTVCVLGRPAVERSASVAPDLEPGPKSAGR